jgi:peptidoglycan/LPS O-acetylase OafA/YrhL
MVASLALPWLVPRRTRILAVIAAACWVGFAAYGIHAGLPPAKIGFNPSIGWNADLFVGGFFRVGFGFILGMILYRHKILIGAQLERRLPSALRHPAVLYAATFAMLANPLAGHGLMAMFNLLVAIPLLVAAGATETSRQSRAQRFSAWLGYLSYPLYCLHFPIGRIVTLLTGRMHLSGIAFTALAGTISILAAMIIGRLVDEPLRRLLTRAVKPRGKPGLTVQVAKPS